MTIAEQQPEEIDNEIKKIMTVTEKQPEEIDDKIKNIMTATEKNPQEIDNKVNIFALLYAADFFQASDAIKAALIKHLFTQVDNPEDHNAIIELLNLNELLSPTIVRNYMPYIAKQYFLRYDKMPEEWKKFHFELSVRELPEHKKQVTKMYIIWGGRSLMLLNLSGNFLTSLDGLKDIPNIEEVENLDISNNNINNFEYMPLLPNLWDLDISNNNISSWKYMPLLPNLLNLNVSNNNISSWEYMPLFPNLVDLDVSKNNISSWEYIPLFPNLEELDMSKNNISSWEYIPLFPNLMDLNVSKNNISSFEHMPPDLAIIEIKENNLSEEEKKRAQEMFPEILFYF
jgi:Leucine-rich repeat (LRR) protein